MFQIVVWIVQGGSTRFVAQCASSSGAADEDVVDDLQIDDTFANNMNCWCKMILPLTTKWVFSMEFASVVNCNKYCAACCSENFADDAEFRDAMLRNIYMVN